MIPILSEPEDLSNNDILEACIFCNEETIFWSADKAINRPICPLCAATNNLSDIPTAKHNY